jgi:hypothetical protein
VNEIAYRSPAPRGDQVLGQPGSPPVLAEPLADEAVQRAVAEVRRDMQQQVEWEVQRRLAVPRPPSPTEAVLVLGSLVTGAVVTGVVVANATTVVSGFLGTQTATHLNTLPMVILVWLAVIGINLIWARRR